MDASAGLQAGSSTQRLHLSTYSVPITLMASGPRPIREEPGYQDATSDKKAQLLPWKCKCELEQKTKQMENKAARQTAKCHLKAPNLKQGGRGLPESPC